MADSPASRSLTAPLVCPHCDRTFTRQEHLARHIVSHTNTKAFTCTICKKRFGRRDVCQRHMRLQHSKHVGPNRRLRAACETCHSRKIKCKPVGTSCERCLRDENECSLSQVFNQTGLEAPEIDQVEDHASSFQTPSQVSQNDLIDPPSASAINIPPTPPSMMASSSQIFPLAEVRPELGDFFIDSPSMPDLDILEQFTFSSHFELLASTIPSELPPTNVSAAYARLHEYSAPTNHSRPASPGAQIEHDKWIQCLGNIENIKYDMDILNVFLNLFRIHLSKNFRCFEQFAISNTTPLELTLAMAGVGALYCSTTDAFKIAKALYNSARVKLLSKVHHQPLSPGNDRLATLQTYMLLEMFGYLSGDERLHEIAEVYHWEMVQIIEMYNLWPSTGSGLEEDRRRTIEGICVLECYRIVILQSPATFSLALPLPLNAYMAQQSTGGMGGLGDETLLAQLEWMTSGNHNPSNAEPFIGQSEIWSLSCLSLLLPWAAPKSNLHRHQLTFGHTRRRDFLESALNKWSVIAYDQASLSTQMLFHMISLNLHVNLSQVESIACQHSKIAKYMLTQTRPVVEYAQDRTNDDYGPVKLFSSDTDRLNAAWHASRIMGLAMKRQQAITYGQLAEEVPHFVYSVYFAALTLWSAQACSSTSPPLEDSLSHGPGLTVPIINAIDILSSSSVLVTKKLLAVLHSLTGTSKEQDLRPDNRIS